MIRQGIDSDATKARKVCNPSGTRHVKGTIVKHAIEGLQPPGVYFALASKERYCCTTPVLPVVFLYLVRPGRCIAQKPLRLSKLHLTYLLSNPGGGWCRNLCGLLDNATSQSMYCSLLGNQYAYIRPVIAC